MNIKLAKLQNYPHTSLYRVSSRRRVGCWYRGTTRKYTDGQLIDEENKNLRPHRWDWGNWPRRSTRFCWACPDANAFQLTPFPFPARYASPFLCSRWILRRKGRGWQEEERAPGEKRKVFIARSESALTSPEKRWRWRSGKERVQVGEQGWDDGGVDE